jgi:hypothetical protein
MTRLLAIAFLVAATGEVRAQEIPPPIIAPPPQQFLSHPQLDFDTALKERGRRNKVAGGILMGVGSGLLLAGQGLLIYELTSPEPVYICPDLASCKAPPRYEPGMLAGGVVMAVVGTVLNVIGIPVYAVGGSQMKKANHRMQLTASGMRLEF